MKVIDLLNKIANGEKVPKKVKAGYYYYEYEENGEYINTENSNDLLFDFDSYYPLETCLNQEVEIIEEDKKIKKIDRTKPFSTFDVADKVDEIVDIINEMREDK